MTETYVDRLIGGVLQPEDEIDGRCGGQDAGVSHRFDQFEVAAKFVGVPGRIDLIYAFFRYEGRL